MAIASSPVPRDARRGLTGESLNACTRFIERASEAYQRACSQLVNGRGNLVKQVNDFKELGFSVKTELGEHWTDRAELELGHDVPADMIELK